MCLAYVKKKINAKNDKYFYIIASNILLCAIVFLEDAVNYQSIGHKVTRRYVIIYRWFSSPMIRK